MADCKVRRFSVIKCECGFEIPVIPDVKMLGETIDAHIEEHRAKEENSAKGEIVAKRVHDNLLSQLFKKISKMSE